MFDDWYEDDHPDYARDCDDERETFGCCMPGRCLMPGMHYPSECHDIEMVRAIEEEFDTPPEAA